MLCRFKRQLLNGRDGIDNDVIIYSVVDSLRSIKGDIYHRWQQHQQYGDIPFSDFFETESWNS